jgi:hypothetical protein
MVKSREPAIREGRVLGGSLAMVSYHGVDRHCWATTGCGGRTGCPSRVPDKSTELWPIVILQFDPQAVAFPPHDRDGANIQETIDMTIDDDCEVSVLRSRNASHSGGWRGADPRRPPAPTAEVAVTTVWAVCAVQATWDPRRGPWCSGHVCRASRSSLPAHRPSSNT